MSTIGTKNIEQRQAMLLHLATNTKTAQLILDNLPCDYLHLNVVAHIPLPELRPTIQMLIRCNVIYLNGLIVRKVTKLNHKLTIEL